MGRAVDLSEGLHRALAQAGDGAFATGPDGSVTLWNRAAERILGWKAKEVLGRSCSDVLASDIARDNGLRREGFGGAGPRRFGWSLEHGEVKTRTKTGRPVWLYINILETPATNGTQPWTVHLFRDISGIKRLLAVFEGLDRADASDRDGRGGLSRRELEILRLMAAGANTKELADRLQVSPATIRNHVQNIFGKLDVHSRLEAVAWANQHQLT